MEAALSHRSYRHDEEMLLRMLAIFMLGAVYQNSKSSLYVMHDDVIHANTLKLQTLAHTLQMLAHQSYLKKSWLICGALDALCGRVWKASAL